MNFGFGVGDMITISELAVRIYTAYQDAPENYRHVSEEVAALQVLIDQVEEHLRSSIIGQKEHQNGQTVLKKLPKCI